MQCGRWAQASLEAMAAADDAKGGEGAAAGAADGGLAGVCTWVAVFLALFVVCAAAGTLVLSSLKMDDEL